VPDAENWTIEKIKSINGRIDRKELKEPRELLGVVSNPVWDFVQPQNYIFPELHAEIGLVNNVLDNFYTFIDDQVEALTPEELTSRNSFIVSDVALTLAMQRVSNWKEDVALQLEFHRYNRIQLSKELKKRGLDPLVVTDLRTQ
jgi:hypothetical protein